MLVVTVPEELTAKRRARPSVPSTWYLWPRPRRFVGCLVRQKEGEKKREGNIEREKDRNREVKTKGNKTKRYVRKEKKRAGGRKRNSKASPASFSVGRNRETGERWRKKNWFQKAARVYRIYTVIYKNNKCSNVYNGEMIN